MVGDTTVGDTMIGGYSGRGYSDWEIQRLEIQWLGIQGLGMQRLGIASVSHGGQITGASRFTIQIFKGRCSCDLYDLAHSAGWEPYKLHDLQHMFAGVGSVPYRSCTASRTGMLGCR